MSILRRQRTFDWSLLLGRKTEKDTPGEGTGPSTPRFGVSSRAVVNVRGLPAGSEGMGGNDGTQFENPKGSQLLDGG